MQPCKDGREERRGREEREGRETERASYFSDVESACECDACVDKELEIFRGHVLMGSYGSKVRSFKRSVCTRNVKTRKLSWFVFKIREAQVLVHGHESASFVLDGFDFTVGFQFDQ